MPLPDDPAIVRRPIGFAVRVNELDAIDVDEQRARTPGLRRFVRTFAGELMDGEFDTKLGGYPRAARALIAKRAAEYRQRDEKPASALPLLNTLVDLCDLEIELDVMSGDEIEHDEDDDGELKRSYDKTLELVQRLLDTFAQYAADVDHLPRVAVEADRGRQEFANMVKRLTKD